MAVKVCCSVSMRVWMLFISSRRSWYVFFVESIRPCKVAFLRDKSLRRVTCDLSFEATSFSVGGAGRVNFSTRSLTVGGNVLHQHLGQVGLWCWWRGRDAQLLELSLKGLVEGVPSWSQDGRSGLLDLGGLGWPAVKARRRSYGLRPCW